MDRVELESEEAPTVLRTGAVPALNHDTLPPGWDAPARGAGSGWIVFAIMMTAIAGVLGYYTWQGWSLRQDAVARLAATRRDLAAAQAKRAQSEQQASTLARESAAQAQRATQLQHELLDANIKVAAREATLAELEEQSAAVTEQLAEFRRVSQQFQRMIDSGKLQVSFRRGRMIVELPAAVLFASGSAELSDDGKSALGEVAKILRQVPRKRFIVGGHTDDVPVSKAQTGFASNWELSAARAVRVTQALVDAGVRPAHLVAAGYGEYDPIASNESARGRQKNRRIEIVLEPELHDLPAPAKQALKKPGRRGGRPD